ncbi:MAG: hypothetical protein ACRDK4_04970 [Solirubrobacteraceae bacterium]
MTPTQPTVADLRKQAKAAGIDVPAKATHAQLLELLKTDEGDMTPTQPTVADGKVEIRRPIAHVTERGDWLDPFSGLTVYYGADTCRRSGAVRDGDEAVLTVPAEEAEQYGD